ncbi:hypothetical protein VPH35_005248 [Triticum aestivum]
MRPLLGKLAALAGEEYSKLKGVKKQASFLEKELSAMNAALEKMELMDELDPVSRDWRDHVREMSYDMENCIDDFIRQFGGGHARLGFITKTARRLKMLGQRHRIADRMEELKVLALEANNRRIRYKIDECNCNFGSATIDPRMSTIYVEAADLVGTDGPMKELINLLTSTEEKKLKVVSIMGFGGLGKTTLAKQVYDEIGGQYDCTVFVPVSQRPNMTGFMTGLLYRICVQLNLQMERSSPACELQDIINDLEKHLTHRRYLIVLDDLWDQSTWNTINRAFPENGNGSGVIVTTRVEDVAFGACRSRPGCIYRMKPLDEQDSKDDHPSQFEEISAEILKKCGGLPLAIITIASLLASRPERLRDEWESIRNSLGAQLAENPALEGVKSILNLSYIHLPFHLRACLLHLGIYPEDSEIKRDDLVRQWLAEGFVSNLHGQDVEVVAKSYFNDLVNRSLIQPGRMEDGELLSCRVHDMMLDLILSKCNEHNFLRVECNYEDMARDHGRKYKVCRISMNFINGGATNDIASGSIPCSLSKVRSLTLFGKCNYMPPLLHFKYLRVLLFNSWGDKVIDLTDISQLFQLRYLKVSYKGEIKLPTKMQGLVHLETLDLACSLGPEIPSDIVHLPRLSHLMVSHRIKLPKGIRNMKSLHTLHGFHLMCSSLEDIEGLGELTNLRSLILVLLSWDGPSEQGRAVGGSIALLHDLRYLNIKGCSSYTSDMLGSVSRPFRHIKVLKLSGCRMPRVPKWICGLQCLYRLEMDVDTCTVDEFHALGELPSLVHLSLLMWSIPEDSCVTFSAGTFPVLENFECTSKYDVTAYLAFGAGAMPKLSRLNLGFGKSNWGGATPVGLEHLLSLKVIYVVIRRYPEGVMEKAEAESAFKNYMQVHPNRPDLYIFNTPP